MRLKPITWDSWQVITEDDGKIEWITEKDGFISSELETEPMTSAMRRVAADALSIVPDDAQL
jgi:hypothetical protein